MSALDTHSHKRRPRVRAHGHRAFLLTGPPFVANTPSLDGSRRYAADLGARTRRARGVDTAHAVPAHAHLTHRPRQGGRPNGDVRGAPLPGPAPRAGWSHASPIPATLSVVTAYIDTGSGRTEVVLDRHSHLGRHLRCRVDRRRACGRGARSDHARARLELGGHRARFDAGSPFAGGVIVPRSVRILEERLATSTTDDEVRVVVPARRFDTATTVYGRILVETTPSPNLRVTVSSPPK